MHMRSTQTHPTFSGMAASLYKYWSVRILLLAELAPTKALNYCNVHSDQPCNYTACHHTNHSTPVICWLQLAPSSQQHPHPTASKPQRSCSAGQSRPLPVFTDLQGGGGGGGDRKAHDKPELSRPPEDKTCTVKNTTVLLHRDTTLTSRGPCSHEHIVCFPTVLLVFNLKMCLQRLANPTLQKNHVCFHCCQHHITFDNSKADINGKSLKNITAT